MESGVRARHRLYIDESGDHVYKLLDEPTHRYLALLGVWFRQDPDYTTFADNLEGFKRAIFGPRPDKPVILTRSAIINRREAFGMLCQPEVRERFDRGLLEVVKRATFTVVCVVIDKKRQLETYANPFHPYHYCLVALLERYCGYLNYSNARGDVMAESRGREEDVQLKQAFRRAYESGTAFFGREQFQRALTTHDIKLEKKAANIAGLQLADVLAHPVKQSMLAARNVIPQAGDVFGRELLSVVAGKFNVNERTGEVEGYGKKWL
jgi:hypothetical protein